MWPSVALPHWRSRHRYYCDVDYAFALIAISSRLVLGLRGTISHLPMTIPPCILSSSRQFASWARCLFTQITSYALGPHCIDLAYTFAGPPYAFRKFCCRVHSLMNFDTHVWASFGAQTYSWIVLIGLLVSRHSLTHNDTEWNYFVFSVLMCGHVSLLSTCWSTGSYSPTFHLGRLFTRYPSLCWTSVRAVVYFHIPCMDCVYR